MAILQAHRGFVQAGKPEAWHYLFGTKVKTITRSASFFVAAVARWFDAVFLIGAKYRIVQSQIVQGRVLSLKMNLRLARS
jgi:hypothetical protein